MITAVDTSVLVDVFVADPAFGLRSHEALAACLTEGRVVASEIVWAELAAVFPAAAAAAAAMERLGIDFAALDAHVRERLAGYKTPRSIWIVEQVGRAPSGKPDYPWAKKHAEEHEPMWQAANVGV